MASLREVGFKNIYALSGLVGLTAGVSLVLWVLLPSPPFIPRNPNLANITCREGKNLCDPLEYLVNLFPDPNSENVLVTVYTSRLSSDATSYDFNWPGKVRRSETASGPNWLTVETIKEHESYTSLTVKGRNRNEPPPPSLEPQQPRVDHDRFDFVWVNGKETMSFTDRRIRLGVSTAPSMADVILNPSLRGRRLGKVSMQVSFVGLQQLGFEAPKASDQEGTPDVRHGAITRHYPETDDVLVVYTEINKRTLSGYILTIAGVLIGVATNLLAHHLIQVAEAWRRHGE